MGIFNGILCYFVFEKVRERQLAPWIDNRNFVVVNDDELVRLNAITGHQVVKNYAFVILTIKRKKTHGIK